MGSGWIKCNLRDFWIPEDKEVPKGKLILIEIEVGNQGQFYIQQICAREVNNDTEILLWHMCISFLILTSGKLLAISYEVWASSQQNLHSNAFDIWVLGWSHQEWQWQRH